MAAMKITSLETRRRTDEGDLGWRGERVRTCNACAGYRYIRAAGGQNTRNWGLDGKSQGPCELCKRSPA